MTFLLDVNVLIALVDPGHAHHHPAHHWFGSVGQVSWATCSITENGLLRIVGSRTYPNSPGSPAGVVPSLLAMRAMPGHTFWHCDVSVVDCVDVDASMLLDAGQITDSYLLALAVRRGGQLATFDKRLVTNAVAGGKSALHLIPR